MSYILEALRRAERDRRRDTENPAAQITAPVAAPSPSRRSTRRWAAIAAVCVVLLTIANLAFFLHGRKSASAPAQPVPATPALPPASAAPSATNHAQLPGVVTMGDGNAQTEPTILIPAGEGEEADNPIADAADIHSFDDLSGAANPVPAPARTPPPRAQERTAQPAVVQPTPPDSEASAAEAVVSESPIRTLPTGPDASPPPAAKTLTTQPAPLGAPEPGADSPDLRVMPDNYRATFPQFTVQVHVYDPDPGKSWVMIDNRRYSVGDTLPQGPKIKGIVSQGIVFDWQGRQVLYPTN
ncbi:MAG: hypothetical protein EPN72_01955 [Nevskiaceae bacterium]|nr:MAG: hypothetical protein EPN63_12705 [Nevskiaceae bacterium]TBR74798.1 MAG: hypothetical protein EPN72_01955 [Nevskiaceae bacterium]